jgi:hypothetical protein
MKKITAFCFLITPLIFLLFIAGCKKEPNLKLPLLSTTGVTAIDSVSAISGGNIFSDGGDPIIAKGICWSTSSEPSISNSLTFDGQGIGSFSSSILGLAKGTKYYVRSYATNSFGTAYGQVLLFYTLGATPVIIPTVQTLEASNIMTSVATLNGTVDNANSVSTVSFDYGETVSYGSSIPAMLNTTQPVVTGSQPPVPMILVKADISGLLPYTTYHFRVRVDNEHGATYGDDFTFMTTY